MGGCETVFLEKLLVRRGLAVGVPKDEIDQWSAERKASYRRGGASMVTAVGKEPDPS